MRQSAHALSAVVAGRAVPLLARRRGHHLISELVREIETARALLADGVTLPDDFRWRRHLRVSLRDERRDEKYHLAPVLVAAGDVEAPYGWEWGGACEQMVHTPLTARAYLALLTALDARLGGSPFGPAGTGKTETVKALGGELGRRVVVFNCDDSFDYEAMGRLFLGLPRRRVGLLRRVQPARGAHDLRRLAVILAIQRRSAAAPPPLRLTGARWR